MLQDLALKATLKAIDKAQGGRYPRFHPAVSPADNSARTINEAGEVVRTLLPALGTKEKTSADVRVTTPNGPMDYYRWLKSGASESHSAFTPRTYQESHSLNNLLLPTRAEDLCPRCGLTISCKCDDPGHSQRIKVAMERQAERERGTTSDPRINPEDLGATPSPVLQAPLAPLSPGDRAIALARETRAKFKLRPLTMEDINEIRRACGEL